MTPRIRRWIDDRKVEIGRAIPDESPDFWRGLAKGYGEAMRVMYPDAQTFMGQEPDATRLVVTYLAIEELSRGD